MTMSDSEKVKEALRDVSDRELLSAIRSGSVSIMGPVSMGASYWSRHTAMREEAKRRGIL